MKLTVDTLDNHVKSAVINVGANNGYVEAFISDEILHVTVYNKQGQAVHNFGVTLRDLKGV
jgi:uncharacterized protein YheU (UPF0270 family)